MTSVKRLTMVLAMAMCLLAGASQSFSATVTWVGGDGSWGNGFMWSTELPPEYGDDVVISKAVKVFMMEGASLSSLTLSGGAQLSIGMRGALTTAANSTVAGGSSVEIASGGFFTVSAGTFTFQEGSKLDLKDGSIYGNGSLVHNGEFNWFLTGANIWQSGTITGTGSLTINGTLNIKDDTLVKNLDGRTITNNGILNLENAVTFLMKNNAKIVNNAAGVLNLTKDYIFKKGDATNPSVENAGLIRKTGGTGVCELQIPTVNNGTVRVDSGTLTFKADAEHSGGFQTGEHAAFMISGSAHTIQNPELTTGLFVIGDNATANFSQGETNGTLRLNGGTLNIETLACSNLELMKGTIHGKGLTVGELTVSESGEKIMDIWMTINGTAEYTGSNFKMINRSKIIVAANANFYFRTDNPIVKGDDSDLKFENNGGVGKEGDQTLPMDIPFDNNGIFNIWEGTVSLNAGGRHWGRFILSENTVLKAGGGTHEFNYADDLNQFEGGMFEIAAGAAAHFRYDKKTLLFSSTDVHLNRGTLKSDYSDIHILSRVFQWTGGTIQAGASWPWNLLAGNMEIPQNTNEKRLDGVTLENTGAVNFHGGDNFFMLNNAKIVNKGTLTVLGDGSVKKGDDTAPSFVNSGDGTVQKTGGTGSFDIFTGFDNAGTVKSASGTVTLFGDGNHAGTFDIAENCYLEASVRTNTFTHEKPFGKSAGTFRLSGTAVFPNAASSDAATHWIFSGGTLDAAGSLAIDGPAAINSGTLKGVGSVTFNGAVSMPAAAGDVLFDGNSVTCAGTWTYSGGNLKLKNKSEFTVAVSGVFQMTKDLNISRSDDTTSQIFNKGKFETAADAAGVSDISVATTNTGMIGVRSKTATLKFSSGFTNGATGRLTGIGTLELPVFRNLGAVYPGDSPGTLAIKGDFPMNETVNDSAASLHMELNGKTADTEYDVLKITGKADLGGTLNVTKPEAFSPVWGDQFTIMQYAEKTETFKTVNLPALSPGMEWKVNYHADNVTLEVGYMKGDVNHDGKHDLTDVILSVQAVTGLPVTVYTEADVNNDGKIGNEEAVFVIQKVSKIRP